MLLCDREVKENVNKWRRKYIKYIVAGLKAEKFCEFVIVFKVITHTHTHTYMVNKVNYPFKPYRSRDAPTV